MCSAIRSSTHLERIHNDDKQHKRTKLPTATYGMAELKILHTVSFCKNLACMVYTFRGGVWAHRPYDASWRSILSGLSPGALPAVRHASRHAVRSQATPKHTHCKSKPLHNFRT
ncbi:hypothetical protein Y032_0214g2335 [Ancylostoma ceylanicum]|uniref:Uncharacterized protein n=1 Tax=Ancylostoma ceylanicum TaxID=53326 RepID=A0A016SKA2_9BILA|nr:hypothetical protein Y032_0214g2335 [Ancylostoma ceylanicum]